MKIAIATDNNLVSGHFGHCEEFTIYELESKKIVSKEKIENPGHEPGFLPVFLNEQGVNTIISGGMGSKAIDLFNEKNIDVITGAVGEVDEIMEKYISGELVSDGSACTKHEHSGDCGNH